MASASPRHPDHLPDTAVVAALLNCVLGAWLIVSPVALDTAAATSITIGAIVLVNAVVRVLWHHGAVALGVINVALGLALAVAGLAAGDPIVRLNWALMGVLICALAALSVEAAAGQGRRRDAAPREQSPSR